MKTHSNIEKKIIGIICLTTLMLPVPLIWMKIGPGGFEYYGSEVPDIYILGANILGKDKSWWGIDFAYKFQLSVIILSLIISVWTLMRVRRGASSVVLLCINLFFWLLFPIWLYFYSNGVISNSDGADLTIYPHVGLLFYVLIMILGILAFRSMRIVNQ